ncbi:MAG: aminopeptidase P family protein [Lachnospiraceae bacterium]|nr:aminopeptidase P family protein [Lachnospiraceae bacterium]
MGSPAKRIERLRKKMKKAGVYAYYIPTADFHASEYVNDHFKVREFFSGFTGSAGELLITLDEALLWTDGRYFIQAERELEGSGIRLMRSGVEGVPSLREYLKQNMPEKAVLGFDGRTVTAALGKSLKKCIPSHSIRYKDDLSEGIFLRPKFPRSDIEVLTDDISGENSLERIAKVRDRLKENGCDAIFISKLDEIAYLFNIRADDVTYTPVAMAYAYITLEKAYIFLMDEKADTGYEASLIKAYNDTESFLKSAAVSGTVMADLSSVSYAYYKLIKKRAKIKDIKSPVVIMKAVKNPVEISHIKDIYLKDSVQLTRFIRWITTTDTTETEVSAAEKLLEYRRKIDEFRDLSFETISAYGDNAAIIHYSPAKEHDRTIEKKGMLMVDSGGQYYGGTTDVTRTIVLGELTEEEKRDFTDVACGMLKILNAGFPKGTTGQAIDVLAREKLWKRGADFRHGTGHGVGYMLSVHEGPQAITSRLVSNCQALLPGMLISDEPGIYREGKYGVRTENILLVKEEKKTEDGTFYGFESLTKVPIDDKGMDKALMSSEEIRMYKDYQQAVYDALSPKLDEDEREWLLTYSGLKEVHEVQEEQAVQEVHEVQEVQAVQEIHEVQEADL